VNREVTCSSGGFYTLHDVWERPPANNLPKTPHSAGAYGTGYVLLITVQELLDGCKAKLSNDIGVAWYYTRHMIDNWIPRASIDTHWLWGKMHACLPCYFVYVSTVPQQWGYISLSKWGAAMIMEYWKTSSWNRNLVCTCPENQCNVGTILFFQLDLDNHNFKETNRSVLARLVIYVRWVQWFCWSQTYIDY
jgi:hypothetical protein